VVDPSIASTPVGFGAEVVVHRSDDHRVLQVVVVVLSDSVALLADTIHNFADAATAIPLGIAFLLIRRGVTRRFTYGLGASRPCGLAIVITIAVSAVLAFYQAGQRSSSLNLSLPLGRDARLRRRLIGNEAVAIFRSGGSADRQRCTDRRRLPRARGWLDEPGVLFGAIGVWPVPAGRPSRRSADLGGHLRDRLAIG